jgi:hypothetical protein
MTKTETYTDQQATDEAVLLLVRKMRRLHTEAYNDLMSQLPEGARWALTMADNRADLLRATDSREGVTREYVDMWADDKEDAEAK